MTGAANRRENTEDNANPNQGNGGGTTNITNKTKGVIIDFLKAKEKLADRRKFDKDIFELVKGDEELMINLYKAFLGDEKENISLEILESKKTNINILDDLLSKDILDDDNKKNITKLINGKIKAFLDKIETEEPKYNNIFSQYILSGTIRHPRESENESYLTVLKNDIPNDTEHKQELIEKIEEIELSYADIIETKKSNSEYYKIENGIKAHLLVSKESNKEFRDLLSPIAFHQLETKGNIINTALNNISGQEIMEKNSLDMFYYFYNEYNLFLIEEEGSYDEGNFYEKFHNYLDDNDKTKASIFHKIFIEEDIAGKELSKKEQDTIVENMKPRLLAYLEREYHNKLSYKTIKKFVENFQVPDSILQIGDKKEIITVNLSISSGIGDNNENQHQNFLDDCKLNLNIEISKDDFEKYPNYLKNRLIINLGENSILLDDNEVNEEIFIYKNQVITVEKKNGEIIEGALHGVNEDGIYFCGNLNINLEDIVSIKTGNIQRKFLEIEEDVSKYLEENEDSNELSIEERFKGLENTWNDIDGTGDFKKGAMLYVSLGESNRLEGEDFGHDYVKFTIGTVNKTAGTLEMTRSFPSSEEEPITKTLNIEDIYESDENNFCKRLEKGFGGTFFRTEGIKSKGGFMKFVSINSKMENQDELNIPAEFKDFIKNDNFGDIAYIGRVDKKMIEDKKGREHEIDSPLFFKVSFGNNKVKLSAKGGGFDTTLTYDEFLVFISDKRLKPYTSEEENEASKEIEDKSETKWTFYSLENVMHLFKMPTEELKTKWKRRDDRLGTELYGKIIGSKVAEKAFGWVPYMNEVSQEAHSQAQHKIKQLIGEYEKHFEDNFSHDAIAAGAIFKEILKDENTALKAHKSMHYKALAAYQFASKKDHPYFRGLKEQAGSGLWVLAILGPNLFEKYKKDFARLQKIAKDNPGDTDHINELAQFEMTFIKSQIDGTGLYPGGTGPGLEGLRDKVSNKVSEGFEDMGNKSNFATKNSSKDSMKGNHRLARWVGGRKGTTKAVYNKMNYKILYRDSLFMSLSGLLNVGAAKNVKTQFDDISKAMGFTPGYYMIDDGVKGGEELADLLDLITRKLMGGVSFKEEIKYNFDELHFGAGYHEKNMEMEKRLKNFWDKYGGKLMDIMNLKDIGGNDGDIFSLLEEDLDDYERKIVENYLYTKSIDPSPSYGEDFATGELNNENIYWKENVMNYPKWVAGKIFSTNQGGQFNDASKKDLSSVLWNNISTEFGKLTSNISSKTSQQKESLRLWGTDKVIQFLEGSGRLPKDVASIIKARSYPIGKREGIAKEILGKNIEIGNNKIILSSTEEIEDFDLEAAIRNTVYQDRYLYPADLKEGVKILLAFLEELR